MPPATSKHEPTADREIVVTRVLDAPRDLVFKVWTDPQHVGQWWGPTGFTLTSHEMDVRPGGVWRFTLHGPDGADYPNRVVYSEVTPPERLIYSHDSDDDSDANGFEVTVTFAEQDGRTRLTLRSLFASAAARDKVVEEFDAIEGANQTLSRLAEHLATLQER